VGLTGVAAERINRLTDLLAQCLAGFLISVAGVLIMDGFFALIGLGPFGDLNGWLALIYPIIVFAGQFAAAKGERGRLAVTVIGALVGLGLGSIAAGAVSRLPPIGSGAVGALVATLVFAAIWHVGLAITAKSS
jgi:hypothetical protein